MVSVEVTRAPDTSKRWLTQGSPVTVPRDSAKISQILCLYQRMRRKESLKKPNFSKSQRRGKLIWFTATSEGANHFNVIIGFNLLIYFLASMGKWIRILLWVLEYSMSKAMRICWYFFTISHDTFFRILKNLFSVVAMCYYFCFILNLPQIKFYKKLILEFWIIIYGKILLCE